MKQTLSLIAIVLALGVLISCSSSSKKKEERVTQKNHQDVHWSHHKGEDGPENWKDLCDGFSDCGASAQSPVNIVTKNVAKGGKLSAPKFRYGKSTVEIINNAHTVQFNVSGNNKVNLKGKDYQLLQFHYHALSEHTIDGNSFPLEVHFVHKHSASDFAVLGILFETGKENELFKKYLDQFPATKGKFKSEEMIDLLSLFPENKSYYNYKGSLTTPPCSEVVNWYVLKTPLTASKEQIKLFSKILNHNYRPVQPLNGREIMMYTE